MSASALRFPEGEEVRRLVLSRDGAVAWVVRAYDSDARQRPLQLQLHAIDVAGHHATLDSGNAIRPRSLRLRGLRLTWRQGDQLRSWSLRDGHRRR